MPKTEPTPCSKEEIDKIIEASIDSDFYYMLFMVAKTTGRRLGELYGSQVTEEIGRKVVGKKIEYDEQGKEVALSKTVAILRKIPGKWTGGAKVKDFDADAGILKLWVLKRRKLVQDESILTPEVTRIIKHYIVKKRLGLDDYLFREKSYRAIQDSIANYSKKAEINHPVSFHNFRHYFVTELKRAGWSNDEIAKLTGHKTVNTLTIYDHVLPSQIKEKALIDLRKL